MSGATKYYQSWQDVIRNDSDDFDSALAKAAIWFDDAENVDD